MVDVFLSYARRDQQVAEAVRGRLAEAGIKVSRDEVLQTGEGWARNITRKLRSASNGLLLLSLSALNSPYVAREYHSILAQKKHLYVALVGPVSRQQIPYELQGLQFVDLVGDFDKGVSELVTAITEKKEITSEQPLVQAVPEEDLSPNAVELKVDRKKKSNAQEIITDLKKKLDSGAHTIKIVSDDDQ
jgi:hypothetical protein